MLKRAGLFFLVIGIGSFILPFVGIQFRLVQALGDTPIVSFGMIGLGVVLFVLGFVIEAASRPRGAIPSPQPMMSSAYAGASPPPMPGAPMTPPPATRLAEDRFAQRCPVCSQPESANARFCGSCGATLPGTGPQVAPPPPLQTAPKRSNVLPIILVVCGLGFVGALVVVGVAGWLIYARAPVAGPFPPIPPAGNEHITIPQHREDDLTIMRPGELDTDHARINIGIARPQVTPRSVEDFLHDAEVCLASRNARGAVSVLTTGLSTYPGYLPLLTARANAHQWNADYPASLADYRDAAARQPDNISVRCEIVRLRLITEPPLNVFAEVQTLMQQYPKDPDVVLLTTEAYLWCNDVNSAGQWIAYLKQIDPNAPEAVSNSGREWVESNVLLRGVFDLCAAVWLDPNNAPAYFHLGRARAGLGQNQHAIDAYTRYLEYEPNGEHASRARAELSRLKSP